ncbi:MAG: phosphatidate cytidylyltransferase [Verrucomicrobia bacterium]|nr:phosphatidate cytidylyltransferase [Verrucomicrobiota bacterium]
MPGADGRLFLIYFLVVTKFSDMGAYATGSVFGRHKMIPRVSPGKTWEGFAGALIFSVGTSLLITSLAGDRLTGMNPRHAILLGLILAVGAVVGDLIESLFQARSRPQGLGPPLPPASAASSISSTASCSTRPSCTYTCATS